MPPKHSKSLRVNFTGPVKWIRNGILREIRGMINFRTQNSRARRVKANSFDINEYQVLIFQKCIDKNIFFIKKSFFSEMYIPTIQKTHTWT